MKKTAMTAFSAAMLASSMASVAVADTNPFAAKVMSGGYQLADYAKDAEGKCGADKASKEGKCGEAKCGADKAAKEGKCGEAKCGADKAAKEGKCGEAKCGAKK
ncbi:hypothetical protein [Zhongshania sp.]|uniref:HvfA family oxazolone/thioamide-modified RiPP metallophore n=1 Tax=Zhongshania sp. TaxID=1971902 RepID=UPI003569FC3D